MPSISRKKDTWKEYRIQLEGRRRADGSLFVTSSNLPLFSAVLTDGKWEDVLKFLKKFLQINFGRVKDLRLIHDASELVGRDSEEMPALPPAYVVAELTPNRVGAR